MNKGMVSVLDGKTLEMLHERFSHAYTNNAVEEELYEGVLMLSIMIMQDVPPSREQSLALTHLEEVLMWCERGFIKSRDKN
jgi:hypothetical protein